MKDKPKPLDLDEFWKENFHNARRFFMSKGNLKTRIKLKNKWKKEFYSRIKFACEFYLRYKDKPALLIKDNPEYRKLFESECVHTYVWRKIFWQYKYDPEKYNEWLFRLAFKGVMRDGNRDNK